MPKSKTSESIAFKPLFIFRIVYILFIFVCAALLYLAIHTDIERIKLDTAADFSARVQHLETSVKQFETLATILSQSITHHIEYPIDHQQTDLSGLFLNDNNFYTLKYFNENYQSGLYSVPPSNEAQQNRLTRLVKTGELLPHLLQEDGIEQIAVYNRLPQAKLISPQNGALSRAEFSNELKENYWEPYWLIHQQKTIHWQLVNIDGENKISLTVSIFDPIQGLIGLVQCLFPQNTFDKEIYQPSGPESLVFLSDLSKKQLLIATTRYQSEKIKNKELGDMKEGFPLPETITTILSAVEQWKYQSDDYFVLSIPIAESFNLVYLTDAKSFSLSSSTLYQFSVILIVCLLILGFFVDRLIFKHLKILKKQDDTLTHQNQLLTSTIGNLEATQKELIHKEKIASLGGVVAGLAHQLNTPLGTAITAISYIFESLKKIKEKLITGITKTELNSFIENGLISAQLVSKNVDKATGLVESFKMLAGHESQDERKEFSVIEYAELVLLGLKPTFDDRRIKAHVEASEDVKIVSYPLAYTQIIVQLINNALIHAFDIDGKISIEIAYHDDNSIVKIDITDNGKGIDDNDINRIFDPFFTSKCASERIGLGLTIVHNLVIGKMQGKISVASKKDHGCCFSILIPNLPVTTPSEKITNSL